jgi:hypothetical protein
MRMLRGVLSGILLAAWGEVAEVEACPPIEMVGDLAAPGSRGEIYSLGADGKGGHMIFGYRAAWPAPWCRRARRLPCAAEAP